MRVCNKRDVLRRIKTEKRSRIIEQIKPENVFKKPKHVASFHRRNDYLLRRKIKRRQRYGDKYK